MCEAHAVCLVHTQASSVVHKGIETHTFFGRVPNEHISPKRAQIWRCKKMCYNGRSTYIYIYIKLIYIYIYIYNLYNY